MRSRLVTGGVLPRCHKRPGVYCCLTSLLFSACPVGRRLQLVIAKELTQNYDQ